MSDHPHTLYISDIKETNDRQYYEAKYLNIEVDVSRDNHYIDIAKLAWKYGKMVNEWLYRNESVKLICDINKLTGTPSITIGRYRTWGHPLIAENVLEWCNADDYARAVARKSEYLSALILDRDQKERTIKQLQALVKHQQELLDSYGQGANVEPKVIYAGIAETDHKTYQIIIDFDTCVFPDQMTYRWSVPTSYTALRDGAIIQNLVDKHVIKYTEVHNEFSPVGDHDECSIFNHMVKELRKMYC